ncbi:MAG: tetratricopeptide repeat protein, partial [Puniceicoccales bacterium]
EAFSRKDFFLIRMDAMAQLGQWRQMEDQLRRSGAPLDEFLRQLFLARAYMETGSESSGKIAWDRAVLEASRDAQKLWYLVQYARQLNFDDEAAAALWKLTDYPAHRQRACEELVQLYQLEYDARGMQKVLRLMVNSYPDNLSALNDWAYVNLLLREQEPAALRAAQKVVLESRHPYLSHYVTLALAYYRMGDFQKAFETLEPLQVNWLTAPPKWRVVYAAILRARGDYAPARQLLQSVDPADLLPEEIALVQVEVAKP